MFPQNSRILVIDDLKTARKILKKVLTDLGYTSIEEAEDGKPALDMLIKSVKEGTPYDVVISDWNMPGWSGISLLKMCRSTDKLKNIPFILVTAESEQKSIIEAAKSGVSDYIVKPYDSETLKAKLERVWSQKNEAKAA